MAENTNASRLYVVKETTPGELKVPTSGAEALALQPGFEFTPEVDVLTNEELRASIGPSKPATGLERPTASFSHYVRHSGIEGVTPDFHLLLESIFGETSTNATERLTAAASTSTLLKLASGGADFKRGKAVLLKDGVNGYSIRPVDSVATNDLTLGFALPAAPGAGLGAGKCLNYSPVNTGHPTLSLWLYRANGAAIEAEAGALITSLELTADVGQYLNFAFTANSTLFYFDPIVITTGRFIDFEDSVGVKAASVLAKIYRTPIELAQALQDAMNAVSADVWTVVYNSFGPNAGKFTFTSNGTTAELLWNTGANAANTIGTKLGFLVAADDTGALTYTSDNAQVWSDALTPALDDSDPLVFKDNEVLLGDAENFVNMCVQSLSGSINLEVADVLCSKAVSGVDSKVVQRRTSSFEVTAVLERHDADKFDRFINNKTTKFLANFGAKAGGNWVPGRCVSIYCPQATVSGARVGDNDGVVTMVFTVSPFVAADGSGEVFLNLL